MNKYCETKIKIQAKVCQYLRYLSDRDVYLLRLTSRREAGECINVWSPPPPSYSLLPSPYPLLPTPYSLLPTPYSLLPTPYSLLPTPYSLLPTPYSLLPTPYSLLPTPYSLLPTPYSLLATPYSLLPTPIPAFLSSTVPNTGASRLQAHITRPSFLNTTNKWESQGEEKRGEERRRGRCKKKKRKQKEWKKEQQTKIYLAEKRAFLYAHAPITAVLPAPLKIVNKKTKRNEEEREQRGWKGNKGKKMLLTCRLHWNRSGPPCIQCCRLLLRVNSCFVLFCLVILCFVLYALSRRREKGRRIPLFWQYPHPGFCTQCSQSYAELHPSAFVGET